MLENIKSGYLIQFIFSLIDQTQKFKIVKYNKNLQKKLELSLMIYKNYTQKYIIYEEKGKGKEYMYDSLCFEGEYKNGERNGYGRELYNEYKLKFEGEYKNGKRNGKGKEFNYRGELIFEGEYLNGKRWKGKGYDYYSTYSEWTDNEYRHVMFKGEYLNGKIWNSEGYITITNGKGYVKKYYDNDYENGYSGNKIEFEGEYLNGERNGKGKEYYENKRQLKFEGEYLNNKRWNGKGYDTNNNIVYELKDGKGYVKEYLDCYNKELFGLLKFEYEVLNGEINGIGKEYGTLFKYSKIFEGEYLNGKKNGKGKEYYYNGQLEFEGEFLNGLKNGKGKYYDKYGNICFEGEYINGHQIKGREYHRNKLVFEGEFLYNKKYNGKVYDENGNMEYEIINGNGKVKNYYYENDILIFEGEYLNGEKHGKAKEYYTNGILEFEGEYLNGKKNGYGKGYDYKGKLEYEGEYLNDEPKA